MRHASRWLGSALLAALVLALTPVTAEAQAEVIEYYATDALGSTRVVFAPDGNVKARSDYLPFGEALATTGSLPAQRFTGQERDGEAGLDNFNARGLSARVGRFTRLDPAGGTRGNPQSWNRYAYVLNNPLSYTDPTGMWSCRYDEDSPPWCRLPTPGEPGGGGGGGQCNRSPCDPGGGGGDGGTTPPPPGEPPTAPAEDNSSGDPDGEQQPPPGVNNGSTNIGETEPPDVVPHDYVESFLRCSSTFRASAIVGREVNATAGDVLGVFEIAGPVSLTSDLFALNKKAQRTFGIFGSKSRYASGINMVIRSVTTGPTRAALTLVGDSLTPPLAVVGVGTLAFNSTVELQCATIYN